MRRLLVLGGVAVLLAAFGLAGHLWLQSGAERAVTDVIAGMRAAGTTVSHGAIGVEPWSRAVSVKQLTLAGTSTSGVSLQVGDVRAEGVDHASVHGAARTLVLRDVTVRMPGGAGMGVFGDVKLPLVTLYDVSLEAPRSEPAAVNGDDVVRWVAGLAAVKARLIEIPSLSTSMTMVLPKPDGRGTDKADLALAYTDIRFENVEDGRIAKASIGKMTIGGTGGGQLMRGSIDGMSMADLDYQPFYGLGLARRTAANGLYKVQGKASIGTYTIALPDGGEMRLGGASASDMWIDPTRASFRSFTDMMQAAQAMGPTPTPQQAISLLTTMSQMYEGIRIDQLEMRDMAMQLRVPAGPTELKIERLSMTGLDRGKLRDFRFAGITGSSPDPRGRQAPFEIGLLAVLQLDFTEMMRFATVTAANPALAQQAPEQMIAAMLRMLGGLEMANVKVVDAQSGHATSFERSKIAWGQFVGDVPGAAEIVFKGRMPLNAADPSIAPLLQAGMRELDLDIALTASYDEPRQAVTFSPMRADVGGLLSATGQLTLSRVPRAAFSLKREAAMAGLLAVELGRLELEVKDRGALPLVHRLAGGSEVVALTVAKALGPPLAVPGQPTSGGTELTDALARFVATPGQTLKLAVTPRAAGGSLLQSFAAAAAIGPGAVLEQLDVRVSVAR